MESRRSRFSIPARGLLLLIGPLAAAQSVAPHHVPHAANVVVPQARAWTLDRSVPVEITNVDVGVVIVEQVATTTLDIGLRNPAAQRTEAELLVPVPAGAAVRSFAFEGSAAEPTALVLSAEEARRTYAGIVAKPSEMLIAPPELTVRATAMVCGLLLALGSLIVIVALYVPAARPLVE